MNANSKPNANVKSKANANSKVGNATLEHATTKRVAFEPVRVGVVGLGAFGRLHAQTLHGMVETELVALVDPDVQALQRTQAELAAIPNIKGWQDLERAVQESNAQAWVIASSTASHVDIAELLLSAGKHVLVEKPLAMNAADAARLEPLLVKDENYSRLMMGHLVLFGSEFQGLQQEAEKRGPLSFIESVRHRPATMRTLYPGESPLRLLMVHDLYMTQVLMRGAEPVQMSAMQRFHREGGVDLVQVWLSWESGESASLTASFLTPPGMPSDGFDRLEIFGQGWAARMYANPRPIEVWDDRARWPQTLEIHCHRDIPSGALVNELRCFCHVVRGTGAVPRGADYADAMQLMRWMDRLEEQLAIQGGSV